MIMGIISFVQRHFNSMIECVMIIPSQLCYFVLWYIIWLLLPNSTKLILRSFIIKLTAYLAIRVYRVFKYTITKAHDEIEKTFGPVAIEAVRGIMAYTGYSDMEAMINSRAYKYIHLGERLKQLDKYTLVDVNGLSEFVEINNNPSKSEYRGHFLVYTNNKGQRYDITPLGKLPQDLPDGNYELLCKVGSVYELVGYYNNPNEISISRREF